MRQPTSARHHDPRPPADGRGRFRSPWLLGGAALALLLVAFAVVRSGRLVSRAGPAGAPQALIAPGSNLLLISIDTLRADRLPAYGYTGVETPAIDRLAREGVLFRSAFTPAPLTLPAHCSLLTGLLPFSHGVRDNAGFQLSPSTRTLAELFKARGYRTGAFVSAFVLDSRWGLDEGFDEYFDDFTVAVTDLAAMAAIQRRGVETWAEAERWLEGAGDDRPFFLWLHLFEPHTPYAPPEPFASRYPAAPYDGEIAYVDSIVAAILARLEARGALDRTAIVLVSDHGEGLGEHGEDEHGLLAYDSTLQVPWILRLPDRRFAATTVDRPVSLVDVLPTLAELFGFTPPGPIDGVSVARALGARGAGGSDVVYGETFYPRLHFGWSELLTVRDARFKYISAPRPELYEYARDGGELRNVIDEHRDVAARLDQVLTKMTSHAAGKTVAPSAVDPETERRLRALGYVGGGETARAPAGARLADPKDKTAAYRALMRGRQMLDTGQEAAGVRALEALLLEEPDLEAAHRALRDHWIGRGEAHTAIARFTALLARRPGDPLLLQDLAAAHRATGQLAAALASVRRILDADPRHVGALRLAGEIAAEQQRHDEALGYFTRALEQVPDSADIALKVAQAQLRLGRLADAEARIARTLAQHPDTTGAHYLLAQIAEHRGDAARAEAGYRREIDAHPWDYQARFNLAMLLARRGAFKEQAALLDSIPPLAPSFHEVHFYRAKAYLDSGDRNRLDDAIAAAQQGLRLAPTAPSAPLGHYVLADVYMLQGRQDDAARELTRGKQLEAHLAGQR